LPQKVLGGPVRPCLRKFKKIYLEITNRCNLACSFCHQSLRPKGCMAPAMFAEVLARLRPHTDHLALHVLGEPLLHPELAQLLGLCADFGLRVNLTTNGTLLPKCEELLLASPALRQVNISLHSFEKQSGGPALAAYLAGVLRFARRASVESALHVSLRLWNAVAGESGSLRRNHPILAELEEFFALPYPLADALTPSHGVCLASRVYLSQAVRFTWPHAPGPDLGERGFCRGLKDHVAILVDGTVVPCCLDGEGDAALGNILVQPLTEILSGPRAVAIHEGFARQRLVEPLCRRCSFRQRF